MVVVRFKILQKGANQWSVEDVVLVSEISIIGHMFPIEMSQSGALDEDIEEKDDHFYLICQLRDE